MSLFLNSSPSRTCIVQRDLTGAKMIFNVYTTKPNTVVFPSVYFFFLLNRQKDEVTNITYVQYKVIITNSYFNEIFLSSCRIESYL
jgi:hypothetical protein